MIEYFQKPKSLGANIKVELDLSNYATKAILKNTTGVDTFDFAKSTDLANLKSDVDNLNIDKLKSVPSGLSSLKSQEDVLDIGKLETTPVDLSKLNNVVKNHVVKKTEYDELVKKVNNINTIDTSNLVKKTDYNTKIYEIEKKITDHDHDKCITTQEFNKLTSDYFTARLAQANLASKKDIANFVKKTDFDDKLKNLNKKVTSNKKKHLLVENESNKLSKKFEAISTKGLTKDLINKYKTPNSAKYFSLGILQNYLMFIPARKYFRFFSGKPKISYWKSNGMSEKKY